MLHEKFASLKWYTEKNMGRVPQLLSRYSKGEEMNIHKYQSLITWKKVFFEHLSREAWPLKLEGETAPHLHVLLIAIPMEGTNLASKRQFALNFLFFNFPSLLFLWTSFPVFSSLSLPLLFFSSSFHSPLSLKCHQQFSLLTCQFLPLAGAFLSPCDVIDSENYKCAK